MGDIALAIVAESLTGGLGAGTLCDARVGLRLGFDVYIIAPEEDGHRPVLPAGTTHIAVPIPTALRFNRQSRIARRALFAALSKISSVELIVHAQGLRSALMLIPRYRPIVTLHGSGGSRGATLVAKAFRKSIMNVLPLFSRANLSVVPVPGSSWKTIWIESPKIGLGDLRRITGKQAEECLRLVWIGRVSPPKDIDQFFELVSALQSDGFIVKSDIYGAIDESLSKHVRAAAEKTGTLIHGHIDDVTSILAQDVVFCLFSFSEGRPFSTEEALSAGVPVIVSDLPGHRMMVADKTYLVSNLAQAKRAALTLTSSSERARIGKKLSVELLNRKNDYRDERVEIARIYLSQ